MTNFNRRLAAVANGQLGIVSRSQAHSIGGSDDQLRRRVKSGTLVPIGRQTFRLPGADITALADLRALMLDIGGDVWASGPTAAALLGFDGFGLTATVGSTKISCTAGSPRWRPRGGMKSRSCSRQSTPSSTAEVGTVGSNVDSSCWSSKPGSHDRRPSRCSPAPTTGRQAGHPPRRTPPSAATIRLTWPSF